MLDVVIDAVDGIIFVVVLILVDNKVVVNTGAAEVFIAVVVLFNIFVVVVDV